LFGIIGLVVIFALMFWNGMFMHGDPIESLQETENNQ